MSQSDSAVNSPWRPVAMVEVDSDREPPLGFSSHLMRGMRFRLNLLEPDDSLATVEGWNTATEGLEAWGEVPDEVSSIRVDATDRGPIYLVEAADGSWIAEVQPWGGPNLRPRSRIAPDGSNIPCGGFQHDEVDLILLRRGNTASTDAKSVLIDHLQRNDLKSAKTLIFRCGVNLGDYHTAAEEEWTNPPDQKRWNERFGEIEQRLKTAALWRAPFTRGAPATLSLGDVRFSMFSEDEAGKMTIRIGPSRLAHGLLETNLDLPAIRDLASLLHDLSRLHWHSETELEIIHLRSALIQGWSSSAPKKWCSKRSFSAHTGGVVIWEYEQALLDVVEAVSHQSGRPEPAVSIIEKVPLLQKSLFNSRILSSGYLMSAMFSLASFFDWIRLADQGGIDFPTLPLGFLTIALFLRHRYQSAAPPAEEPIH
ncbi:MAG: hypothetical protein CND66_00710 [Marine Group II euryarchaeote MED-G37]|nr:MAG: hypothetical protein CND66_00710 [Marine Group II euryarchaeote MED-G37]